MSIYGDNPDNVGKLPKWKGMNQRVSKIFVQDREQIFISFKQAETYERKIYFMIMQDIVDSIDGIENKQMLSRLKEVLTKWSAFFQFEKEYVLSENAQQGLYGELHILEKMIEIKGEDAVKGWTGCNAENHDFYFGADALEVKSSSAKGTERIKISNEYQLDDKGIAGRLYLMYLKMKKSVVYGEVLPDIVSRIMDKLSVSCKVKFQEKLLKVGYLYQLPELYVLHFKIHEECCYIVEDGFPRITTQNINKGIAEVAYSLSLEACDRFLITVEAFYQGVLT